MADRTGRCMCGAVSFSATDMKDTFSACHCKMCQRWVGGAFRGVSVKTENLSVSGAENVRIFQSSDFAERANCRICGSALWYRLTAGKYVGNTSIPVGLLDQSDGMVLSTVYFPENRNSTDEVPEGCTLYSGADVARMIDDFTGNG